MSNEEETIDEWIERQIKYNTCNHVPINPILDRALLGFRSSLEHLRTTITNFEADTGQDYGEYRADCEYDIQQTAGI